MLNAYPNNEYIINALKEKSSGAFAVTERRTHPGADDGGSPPHGFREVRSEA